MKKNLIGKKNYTKKKLLHQKNEVGNENIYKQQKENRKLCTSIGTSTKILYENQQRLSTNKQDVKQSIYYLNCYKVSFSKWFISKELLPVLGLDVQFFNCLYNKYKQMKCTEHGSIQSRKQGKSTDSF